MNLPYADVVRVLKAGPPTRGQKRLKYMLRDQSRKDIYSLLLKILGDNPPLVELDMEELLKRVQDNVTDVKITTRKIKDALKNWQKILDEQSALYQVFEWKEKD